MTHRRTSYRRLAAAATGVAALLAGTFAVSQANANPTPSVVPDVLSSAQAGELATTLTERLGAEAAGTYYDSAKDTLVVNVVDEATAEAVEEAGATARLVDRSLAELDDIRAQVEEFAVPGTSWSTDPVTNTVKVAVDSTVTGGELAEIRDAVEAFDGAATLEQRAGEFQPFIAGGDAIYSSGARCSLGFNVSAGGAPAFLTAGHCGSVGSGWSDSSGGGEIGTMTAGEFPGADYALVEYTASVDNPSAVNLYNGSTQSISGAGEATVGQEVQRSGSTTGLHGGEVTGVDVSVSYPQGTVNGTIETTVCAEPGDSGGSLFAGSTALGITSGGSGNCSSGGTTFFYPVVDALAATGASLP
ncbi:S1 family peptidase [Streptomyces sp. SBT349]|uniref:S1 family peptidase n=1 Tax=Streptomyces sp. SBT349 TaxID=1580539 RepID=UPI00066DEA16|nr:S1 family peptidase [Streptomyces sp. SBT349]